MKQESDYKLRKRIKSLEADVEKLRYYRSCVLDLYAWLHTFANKEKTGTPNAAFGLERIGRLLP